MAKEKAKKSIFKRWWFWVVAVIIIIGVSGGGEGEDTEAQVDVNPATEASAEEPAEEPVTEEKETAETEGAGETEAEETATEEEVVEEDTEPEPVTYSSGMYEVGTEIEPGIYYNPDGSVYAERLAGFSGELDDIIANANPNGPYYMEIKESDAAVSFGNGGWRLYDGAEKERHDIKKSFSSGIYLVGVDIEPGKYKLEGDGIYWARLSGVSLEMTDIIANGNPTGGSAIVEVSPNDFAFEVSGGEWTKVE
ncbi:hypothetical protein ACGTN9_01015 [Halobacillus sp. MO56]